MDQSTHMHVTYGKRKKIVSCAPVDLRQAVERKFGIRGDQHYDFQLWDPEFTDWVDIDDILELKGVVKPRLNIVLCDRHAVSSSPYASVQNAAVAPVQSTSDPASGQVQRSFTPVSDQTSTPSTPARSQTNETSMQSSRAGSCQNKRLSGQTKSLASSQNNKLLSDQKSSLSSCSIKGLTEPAVRLLAQDRGLSEQAPSVASSQKQGLVYQRSSRAGGQTTGLSTLRSNAVGLLAETLSASSSACDQTQGGESAISTTFSDTARLCLPNPSVYTLPDLPKFFHDALESHDPVCKRRTFRFQLNDVLFNDLLKYGVYPKKQFYRDACCQLIRKYDQLSDQSPECWALSLENKFKYYRKLTADAVAACPERQRMMWTYGHRGGGRKRNAAIGSHDGYPGMVEQPMKLARKLMRERVEARHREEITIEGEELEQDFMGEHIEREIQEDLERQVRELQEEDEIEGHEKENDEVGEEDDQADQVEDQSHEQEERVEDQDYELEEPLLIAIKGNVSKLDLDVQGRRTSTRTGGGFEGLESRVECMEQVKVEEREHQVDVEMGDEGEVGLQVISMQPKGVC